MTDPKHEELALAGIVSNPQPHSNKTCSCKSSTWRFTLSNSCHWFSRTCVFQFNRQFLWEKRCFEKQSVRCLSCIRKPDLHLGKTCFIKQVFRCVLRRWYCLFLRALRVCHLVCHESCFDKICAEIAACRRVLDSIFTFDTLYLSRFSTLHSCFPGCIPSVERLSNSVRYSLDFEHLQNDTDKDCPN